MTEIWIVTTIAVMIITAIFISNRGVGSHDPLLSAIVEDKKRVDALEDAEFVNTVEKYLKFINSGQALPLYKRDGELFYIKKDKEGYVVLNVYESMFENYGPTETFVLNSKQLLALLDMQVKRVDYWKKERYKEELKEMKFKQEAKKSTDNLLGGK